METKTIQGKRFQTFAEYISRQLKEGGSMDLRGWDDFREVAAVVAVAVSESLKWQADIGITIRAALRYCVTDGEIGYAVVRQAYDVLDDLLTADDWTRMEDLMAYDICPLLSGEAREALTLCVAECKREDSKTVHRGPNDKTINIVRDYLFDTADVVADRYGVDAKTVRHYAHKFGVMKNEHYVHFTNVNFLKIIVGKGSEADVKAINMIKDDDS